MSTSRPALYLGAAALFFAVFALVAIVRGYPAGAAHGGMDAMSIDMDVTGNDATTLGPRDQCIEVSAGDVVIVDVTAADIPAANPMVAFGYTLHYPVPGVSIIAADHDLLLAAMPDSSIFNASEPIPDSNGAYDAVVLDVGDGEPESGSGVLSRLSLDTTGASAGVYPLWLDLALHIDVAADAFAPHTLNGAFLAVDDSCDNLPPPTPTPPPPTQTPPPTTPTPPPATPTPPPATPTPTPDPNSFTLVPDPPVIPPGGSTAVSVVTSGGPSGLLFTVAYDPGVLSVTDTDIAVCNAATPGFVTCVSLVVGETFDPGEVVAVIDFAAAGDAADGPTVLDASIGDCVDVQGDPLECTISDAVVIIGTPIPTATPSTTPTPTATPPPCPPPDNDDFANAVPAPGLPFEDFRDTRCATTQPGDPVCAGNGPTVWYSFTPSEDRSIAADTFGSSYDTTLSVYTGSHGSLTQIACNDDAGSLQSRVTLSVAAGETYYFMVGAFASGPGGDLVFRIEDHEPLDVHLSADRQGTVIPRDGVAMVSGSVTCNQPAIVDIAGELRQRSGRSIITGFFFSIGMPCDGETEWSAIVESNNGLFTGGKAELDAIAFAFNAGEFDESQVVSEILLKGARPDKPVRCPRDRNLGFEAGAVDSNDIPCWTVVEQPGSFGSWCTQAGDLPPLGPCTGSFAFVDAPPEGSQSAMTGQSGVGSHVLYQCGVLRSSSISFQLYLNNLAGDFISPPSLDYIGFPNQQFRADLVREDAIRADPFTVDPGDILQNLYQTMPGDAPWAPYHEIVSDVSAHVGESVCLRFAEVDNQFYFHAGVDDVYIEFRGR